MMVLLSHQKAKFNVTQVKKLKKMKIRDILDDEKRQHELQKRKVMKLWQKRVEFMQGIEKRLENANQMTEQYENLYKSLVQDNQNQNQKPKSQRA